MVAFQFSESLVCTPTLDQSNHGPLANVGTRTGHFKRSGALVAKVPIATQANPDESAMVVRWTARQAGWPLETFFKRCATVSTGRVGASEPIDPSVGRFSAKANLAACQAGRARSSSEPAFADDTYSSPPSKRQQDASCLAVRIVGRDAWSTELLLSSQGIDRMTAS
jgi:hypothetical protein